jgi:hypothetical protein
MAGTGTKRRAAPHPAAPPHENNRLRVWLLACLLVAMTILLYGLLRHSPPSAFDRPEAQIPNKLRSSWGVANPL